HRYGGQDVELRIDISRGAAEQLRQRLGGVSAVRRTVIDVGAALRERGRVVTTSCKRASSTLCLRQQVVDALDEPRASGGVGAVCCRSVREQRQTCQAHHHYEGNQRGHSGMSPMKTMLPSAMSPT